MSEEKKFVAEKRTPNIDVYHVPNATFGGWTRVYIDHNCNGIQYMGDYVSGSYMFGSIGPDTMQEFLLGCDFDYFMKKTRPNDYKVFDDKGTLKSCRTYLLEERLQRSINEFHARKIYNGLIKLERHLTRRDSATEMAAEIFNIPNITELYDYEGDIHFRYKPCPICQMFWNGPWEALCDLWRTELEEKEQAA